MNDIAGKKVFITGGAIRVGAVLVRAFARAGARVVIHCNKSVSEGQKLLESIGGEEKGHSLFAFDLACDDLWNGEEKTLSLKKALEGVDILINNASCYFRKDLKEESMQEMLQQFQINFFAPVYLMKLFALQAAENSCIIHILDQGIAKADGGAFSYALSKKALAEAVKSAALTYAPRIRVNGVAPGPMIPPTDMPFSKMEKSVEKIPLKKAVDMEDLAESCLFLARNSSITGAVLFVDGGLHLM